MGRHVLNGPGILKYLWISFWPGHGELFLSVVQVTGKADSPRLSTVLRVAPVFWGRPMYSCPSHTSHPTPSIALRASLGACTSPVSSPLRTSTVQACSVPVRCHLATFTNRSTSVQLHGLTALSCGWVSLGERGFHVEPCGAASARCTDTALEEHGSSVEKLHPRSSTWWQRIGRKLDGTESFPSDSLNHCDMSLSLAFFLDHLHRATFYRTL